MIKSQYFKLLFQKEDDKHENWPLKKIIEYKSWMGVLNCILFLSLSGTPKWFCFFFFFLTMSKGEWKDFIVNVCGVNVSKH